VAEKFDMWYLKVLLKLNHVFHVNVFGRADGKTLCSLECLVTKFLLYPCYEIWENFSTIHRGPSFTESWVAPDLIPKLFEVRIKGLRRTSDLLVPLNVPGLTNRLPININQNSHYIVNDLYYNQTTEEVWFYSRQDQKFSVPKRQDRLWARSSRLFNGNRGLLLQGYCSRGVKLTTYLYLV
jgi:hypothetical protein